MIVSHEVHIETTDLIFVYDVIRLSYKKIVSINVMGCHKKKTF